MTEAASYTQTHTRSPSSETCRSVLHAIPAQKKLHFVRDVYAL